jgi:hypothetical protein
MVSTSADRLGGIVASERYYLSLVEVDVLSAVLQCQCGAISVGRSEKGRSCQ